MREDGTAVDALIFQLDTLPAPERTGTPESMRTSEGVFLESGGRVAMQAEHFASRYDVSKLVGDPRSWRMVPGEGAGEVLFLNYEGSGYLQVLPDMSIHDSERQVLIRRACVLAAFGHCEEASEAYKRLAATDAERAELLQEIRDAFRDVWLSFHPKGKYEEAIEKQTFALKALNMFLEGADDTQDDKMACDVLAALYSSRGKSYWETGDFDKAIAGYTEIIRLDPENAEAYRSRAIAFRERKPPNFDRAIADLNEAIRLEPKTAHGYFERGWSYCWRSTQYDKAIADFTEAIRLDPKLTLAYNDRGVAYRNKGDFDKAFADFAEAIRLDPNFDWPLRHRAKTYQLIGELDKAIADYTEIIRLDPENANAYNTPAWLLATGPDARGRDPKRAVELAKKAVELDPSRATFHNTLGVAQYRAGQWEAAIASLKESLELQGDNHKGNSFDFFFLAMAHWQLGNQAEARQWYVKGVESMKESQPDNEEITRFRAEAAELFGVTETPPEEEEQLNKTMSEGLGAVGTGEAKPSPADLLDPAP